MFDNFGKKKKQKQGDIFTIPDKRYSTDPKAISKLSTKNLIELYHDQQKYIKIILQKFQLVKHEYQRVQEKCEQLMQKNDVVNSQISRMTNEHEELSIKFDNLQCSLEILSSDSQTQLRKELEFFKKEEISVDKMKSLPAVLTVYREKYSLCKKIEQQNKNIKARYAELEEQLNEAQGKIKQLQKEKTYNSLIPSLMQQIKQLKTNHQEESTKESQTEQLQQRLLLKVKNQIQTSSTVRSSEEDEELRQKQLQLNQVNADLKRQKGKYSQLVSDHRELKEELDHMTDKIRKLERQLKQQRDAMDEVDTKLRKVQKQFTEQTSELQKERSKRKQNDHTQSELESLIINHNQVNTRLKGVQQELKCKHEQVGKLNHNNQMLTHDLTVKTQELQRQKQNKATFENLINSKSSSELQSLMQMNATLQQQLTQNKKNLDVEKKALIESQSKCKKMNEDIQSLTLSLKRMGQEKAIIQQNVNNCLKISQQDGDTLRKEIEKQKKTRQELTKEVQTLTKTTKKNQDELKNYAFETEKLAKTINTKDNQLRKSYANSQQLERDKADLNQSINVKEDEFKMKCRKYESELNQERIKLESVNRKLNIFETQSQENKNTLTDYYQQLVSKESKLKQMQTKLKQYKYKIQVLRKQKLDIENTYESKLNSMQPEELNLRISQRTQESKNQDKQEVVDEEKELMRNELFSLKAENKAILGENQSLRDDIENLKGTIKQKDRNVKILQEKRDNIMKEMEKMGRNSRNINPQHILTPIQVPSKQQNHEGRYKKIAAKALKGFQIIIKIAQQLYKSFVCIFAQQMQQNEIKSLQKQINAIIKRSNDMKDVFEGYLQ